MNKFNAYFVQVRDNYCVTVSAFIVCARVDFLGLGAFAVAAPPPVHNVSSEAESNHSNSRLSKYYSATLTNFIILEEAMEDMSAAEALAATSAGAMVTAGAIYIVYRRRTRPRCWFCHATATVPYADRNGWTCPESVCGQYNGFDDDGDYNRVDGDMFRELPAPKNSASGGGQRRSNGLCRTCNLNQELKIHQLARFSPKDPARYDQEIEEFEAHLERTYRLCRTCKSSFSRWFHPHIYCDLGNPQVRRCSIRRWANKTPG